MFLPIRRIHFSSKLLQTIPDVLSTGSVEARSVSAEANSVSAEASGEPTKASNIPMKDTTYRVYAAGILVRNPVTLRPLTEFETAYESYRHGLQEEYSRGAFDIMTAHKRELARMQEERGSAASTSEFPSPPEYGEQEISSLMRKLDRKLYFVIKDDSGWKFPSVLITFADMGLRGHVRRLLNRIVGKECEIYHVGNAPVAYHKEHMADRASAPFGTKTFFLRSQLVGGKLAFTPSPFARSVAWLTKEELEEFLPADYYQSVKPALSY